MNTEGKAKAYNKVREKIALRFGSNVAEEIFSEFEMSEDEKIRKTLIEYFDAYPKDYFGGLKKSYILAWLEKQGEQKPYGQRKECLDCQFNYAGECKGSCQMKRDEQKPIIEMKSAEESLGISSEEYNDIVNECLYGESESSDKVELKFKVGDWITNGDYTWKIIEVKPLDYILQSQDGNIVDDTISHVDEQFHSFTIKDAKKGDVLCCETDEVEWIFIYREIVPAASEVPHDLLRYYFLLDGNYFSWNGVSAMVTDDYELYLKPATKSQRDTLFAKMKEEGYEWSEETHELKKISQRMVSAEAKEALYDKPAWSEEDMKEALRTEYEKGKADAEMKLSWSEDDEKMLDAIIDFFENGTVKLQHDLSLYASWLKSLRPQKQWRPSDEQMEAFEHFVRSIGEIGYASPYDNNTKLLYSLLNDLKKLIE